jgi:hypothetical protein
LSGCPEITGKVAKNGAKLKIESPLDDALGTVRIPCFLLTKGDSLEVKRKPKKSHKRRSFQVERTSLV